MAEPLRLLLIEDSDDDALLVVRALRQGDFAPEVERVQSAPAMRLALQGQGWDVIIADYSLPQFSAPEALRLLQESGRDIPFIVVSGTIGEEAAVELMRQGAVDYVMKEGLGRLPEAVRREMRDTLVRAERRQAELERQRASGALEQINRELERIVEERTASLSAANVQLAQANLELARATRLKDEFLATMSHELRTPLNSILGLSESLQDELYGPLSERQSRALVVIEQSGRHLLNLINDILDLSKITSGMLKLDLQPVSVGYLCDNSLIFVREQAIRKAIQLSSTIDPHLKARQIVADELRLRQVLINLLANAVKFTPEGGSVELRVELVEGAGPAGDDRLRFHVIDSGIGIAAENLGALFQPFVQVDSSLARQQGGTGLGLALVKQITELHYGRVSVDSQLGVGSSFTVDLPFLAGYQSRLGRGDNETS